MWAALLRHAAATGRQCENLDQQRQNFLLNSGMASN